MANQSIPIEEFFNGVTRYWDTDEVDGSLRNRATEMVAVFQLIQHLRQYGIYTAELVPIYADVAYSLYINYDDMPNRLADKIYSLTISLFGKYAIHRENIVDGSTKSRLFWETYMMVSLLDTMCERDDAIPVLCGRIIQDHSVLEELVIDE